MQPPSRAALRHQWLAKQKDEPKKIFRKKKEKKRKKKTHTSCISSLSLLPMHYANALQICRNACAFYCQYPGVAGSCCCSCSGSGSLLLVSFMPTRTRESVEKQPSLRLPGLLNHDEPNPTMQMSTGKSVDVCYR